MTRNCDSCKAAFVDGEPVTAIVDTTYKQIASKVHFALALPRDVLEIYHPDCWAFEMGQLDEQEGGN